MFGQSAPARVLSGDARLRLALLLRLPLDARRLALLRLVLRTLPFGKHELQNFLVLKMFFTLFQILSKPVGRVSQKCRQFYLEGLSLYNDLDDCFRVPTLEVTFVPGVLATPSLFLSAGLEMGLTSVERSRAHTGRLARLDPIDASDTDGALSDAPRLPLRARCCFFLKSQSKESELKYEVKSDV